MSNQSHSHKACGAVDMQPPDAEKKYLRIGFEHGCTCPRTHLGLRFHNQPGTGADGKPFPREQWEASELFLPLEHARELAGIQAPLDRAVLQQIGERSVSTAEREEPRMTPVVDPWREALQASPKVTAEWFVLHDTCGGITPKLHPGGQDRGVHIFIGPTRVFLNRDFSVAGGATMFEWPEHHREFHGKLIHCELENLSQKNGTPASDPYASHEDFQYRMAALAYVFASYRAGHFLTVTAHIAVDLGIPNGHSDPRGFDYAKLYRIISAMTGMPPHTTYGLLREPTGKDYNDRNYINTFPAQYEPATKQTQMKK